MINNVPGTNNTPGRISTQIIPDTKNINLHVVTDAMRNTQRPPGVTGQSRKSGLQISIKRDGIPATITDGAFGSMADIKDFWSKNLIGRHKKYGSLVNHTQIETNGKL